MNELGSTGRQSTGSARGGWQPAGAPAARSGSPYPAPQGPADRQPYTGPQGPGGPYGRPYAPPNAGGPLPQNAGPQGPGGPYARRPYPPNAGAPYGAAPHPGWSGADPQPAGSHPEGALRQRPAAYPGPQRPGPVPPTVDGPPRNPAGASDASPRRRGRVGRWIGVAVVVAALGGVGWYVTFGAPSPVTAAVGDCVSQTGGNDVKVVGCGEPAAQFRVAGKVENKTMIAASLFACSDFPDATSSFWQGVQDKPGTVLCLAPLHP